MTVLRKSRELKAHTTRRGPYTVLSKMWVLVTGSILLDPALALFADHQLPDSTSSRIAALCALLTIPFLRPEIVHRYISALRRAHTSDTSRSSRIGKALVLACLIAPVLSKLILVPRLDNFIALSFLGILAFGAFTSVRKALRDRTAEHKLFKESPIRRIKQWEEHLVTITTISFIAARTISLCGVFSESSQDAPIHALSYTAMSALFLLMLRPKKQLFIGGCKKCKRPVSAAFVDYGSCPLCDEALREPPSESSRS